MKIDGSIHARILLGFTHYLAHAGQCSQYEVYLIWFSVCSGDEKEVEF